MTDINTLRSLLAKASKGEWMQIPKDESIYESFEAMQKRSPLAYFVRPENRDVIIALHNSAPGLLDELEKLRAALAEAREAMEEIKAKAAVDTGELQWNHDIYCCSLCGETWTNEPEHAAACPATIATAALAHIDAVLLEVKP